MEQAAGTGIVFALVAMLVVMPALIALLERTGLLTLTSNTDDPSEHGIDKPFPVSRLTPEQALTSTTYTAQGSFSQYQPASNPNNGMLFPMVCSPRYFLPEKHQKVPLPY